MAEGHDESSASRSMLGGRVVSDTFSPDGGSGDRSGAGKLSGFPSAGLGLGGPSFNGRDSGADLASGSVTIAVPEANVTSIGASSPERSQASRAAR